jgi:hypothetical protein
MPVTSKAFYETFDQRHPGKKDTAFSSAHIDKIKEYLLDPVKAEAGLCHLSEAEAKRMKGNFANWKKRYGLEHTVNDIYVFKTSDNCRLVGF